MIVLKLFVWLLFDDNGISIYNELNGCCFFYHIKCLLKIAISLEVSREMIGFHDRGFVEHVDVIPAGKSVHDILERFIFEHEHSFSPSCVRACVHFSGR